MGVAPSGRNLVEYQDDRQTTASTSISGAVTAAVSAQFSWADMLSTSPNMAPIGIHAATYRMKLFRLARRGCIAGFACSVLDRDAAEYGESGDHQPWRSDAFLRPRRNGFVFVSAENTLAPDDHYPCIRHF